MIERRTHYLSPLLEARPNPAKGRYGVFARTRIPAGQLLVVWGDDIVTAEEFEQLSAREKMHTIQVEEELYQVPCRGPEPGDFINHCCDPNAGLRGQLSLVALRPIAAGEEVCYDYAMSDGSAYDEFCCDCGVRRCRGRVTGDDWQLPELWARYGEHFSPYLLARIDALRERPSPSWAPLIVHPRPRTRSRTRA